MRLTVSVSASSLDEMLDLTARAVESGAEQVEERIDGLRGGKENYLIEAVDALKPVRFNTIPKTITNRLLKEAGPNKKFGFKGAEELRILSIAYALSLGLDADIELVPNKEVVKNLVYFAGRNEGNLTVSAHDFEKTPKENELKNIFDEMIALGSNNHKQVYLANSYADAARTLNLIPFAISNNIDMTALPMGKFGPLGRVVAGLMESYQVFCKLDDSEGTANGQISVRRYREIFPIAKEIYRTGILGNENINSQSLKAFHQKLKEKGVEI